MKNISKKTLSIIITICIAAMSMTLLASCTNTQNNSAKSSNAVSANSKEDNAEDDYLELVNNYLNKLYQKVPDIEYAAKNSSRLCIEMYVHGDPDNENTMINFENYLESNLSNTINNLGIGDDVKVENFKIRHDQEYNKDGMDEIRKLINKKFDCTKGKDISDVHVLSYSGSLVGSEGVKTKRFNGIANVVKEEGQWKICDVMDSDRNETDLLTGLEVYSGDKTADTDTDVESSSKSQAEKTFGTTIGENEDYGYGFQAQSKVCPICGGSGFQQIVAYVDQNGIPVYNSVACSGCGGSGHIN